MLKVNYRQQRTPLEQGIPDGILVNQALAGDHCAFDALVNRYHSLLARYIRSFFKDGELVFDVLQHVFLQLYLSLPALLTHVSLRPWLFQVAHNRALDELRRLHRYAAVPFSSLAWENEKEELRMVLIIRDPDPLPEEVIEVSDQYGSLHRAIASLSPTLRSILLLHCFQYLTFTEIGHLLHMPTSTVKVYYYRSLPRLRKALVCDVCFDPSRSATAVM